GVILVSLLKELLIYYQNRQITAAVHDDVVLQCFLKPKYNATPLRVEWILNKSMVHVYRSYADDASLQDANFKNRASLFHDEMSNGNISLKLKNVTERDSGNYTCHVRENNSDVIMAHVCLCKLFATISQCRISWPLVTGLSGYTTISMMTSLLPLVFKHHQWLNFYEIIDVSVSFKSNLLLCLNIESD
uniref:Ig-like domain-containing protein n=1 Tax=Seriola dumerili TaxID=41447 RepID=A0A3B4VS18_SERDU